MIGAVGGLNTMIVVGDCPDDALWLGWVLENATCPDCRRPLEEKRGAQPVAAAKPEGMQDDEELQQR